MWDALVFPKMGKRTKTLEMIDLDRLKIITIEEETYLYYNDLRQRPLIKDNDLILFENDNRAQVAYYFKNSYSDVYCIVKVLAATKKYSDCYLLNKELLDGGGELIKKGEDCIDLLVDYCDLWNWSKNNKKLRDRFLIYIFRDLYVNSSLFTY